MRSSAEGHTFRQVFAVIRWKRRVVAVRRNIAARHGEGIFRSEDPNPWHTAYRITSDEAATFGEFAPHWVYPEPARIERLVAPYPLSSNIIRLGRLKEDLALYRLTFGQPRQGDMLELLRHRAINR